MYNLFRLGGDFLHMLSILILIYKIHAQKSCAGISLKTQILYAVVYVARYTDLLNSYISLYNSGMKLVFICSSFYVIYLMKVKYQFSYSSSYDTFRIGWLVGLCAVLSVVLHYSFAFEGSAFVVFLYDIQELLWTFSIYLESVAILPQLFLLQRTGEAEALTADYVFCLGGYRFLYIFNWIWRAAHTPGYQDWIVWVSGFIQTALYGDFFYYYVKCKYYGGAVKLPQ